MKILRVLTPNTGSFIFKGVLALLGLTITLAAIAASFDNNTAQRAATIDPNAMSVDLDRGANGLSRGLAAIRTRASILMVVAHPDDEDGGLLAYQTRGLGARGELLSLTRGEGGQNAMSEDLYDALGLVRTEELLMSDRYYGASQYWGREIDYGFSKTREEALEKWGYDRVLSDVVRVIRMTRPLVITSVFIGAPTDGHGNHQVSGQMAQEAFLAAGDPNRFPEQIREGLRPWQPLKVYCRVPFFEPTKQHNIYDYATDKYVPLRFFNYVNKTWSNETPAANYGVAEGTLYPVAGLTFLQIGREGWGYQKSQNGGGTIPQPSLNTISYHRYGSRVSAKDKEDSLYDGIDVSLMGIASLAAGDKAFLNRGLERISNIADDVCSRYKPEAPANIAPRLADGLNATRSLLQEVHQSSLPEPGKSDVVFELHNKEDQFEQALVLAVGLSFNAVVTPEREPTGPFARFAGATTTSMIAIPGQSFPVQVHLMNAGSEALNIESIEVKASDGKEWAIRPEGSPVPTLGAGKDMRQKFAIKAPLNATLTKPYFSRRDQEQPYYDLTDERFRNLSFAPYPLFAVVRLMYRGAEIQIQKVVQTNQRLEGIGIKENPMLMGPAISVSVSPSAGAVPLTATSFEFSCTVHSNVKGPAQGVLRLRLPPGWQSEPNEVPFSTTRDDESETLSFHVAPHSIHAEGYEIKAIAEYGGKTYEEGYRLVGYPGLRPYPYYRPASYKAVGVDVKTAPGLHVAFFPGTGDDVPRALEDLGLRVQILSGSDLETGNLNSYDAMILGTRAYAVRPELRAANKRLLEYVKNGGALIVQYNLQNFDGDYGPYPFTLGANPQKVVDETSQVKLLEPRNPVFAWPNKITTADFNGWEEERGHGFLQKWDPHYQALIETHDPEQDPQSGGLLIARYGRGFYIYDAFALYRQLPSGVPGAYRILANLVSIGKNPEWK
jgi:LmbE family N-acetylglucosaminyl deacetylase